MSKVLRQNVGGQDYTMAGCALTASCSSSGADFVKNGILSDGDSISDGMFVTVMFTHGNTAGNAPYFEVIYSSDQVNYFYDAELTQPVTLAPENCRVITYTGTGNAYEYITFPVLSLADITAPICSTDSKYAGGEKWNDNSSVIFLYSGGKFLIVGMGDNAINSVVQGEMRPVTSNAVANYVPPLASHATSADSATNAGNATNAGHATSADSAGTVSGATRSHQIFETDDNGNPSWRNREDVTVGWAEWASYKNYAYQTVDCSGLDQNTWYPCVLPVPPTIITQIYSHTALDGRSHPSWATHAGGFTAILHIEANGGGWGGTGAKEIVYIDNQQFYSGDKPVGYTYSSPSNWFIFYLRGGGVYNLSADNGQSFTLYSNGVTDAGGAVWGPVTTPPSVFERISIGANLNGTASEATHAIAADNASYASASGSVTATVAAGASGNLVYATMADNDQFRISVWGGSNDGHVALETADDGTESIEVAQYTGVFTSEVRRAYLLDASGNTSFPGTVSAPNFAGLASQATLAYKIRVGAPASPEAGDIWVD